MYLTQGLHRALQQFPDAPATICGERRRTAREVADRVARLAAALQSLEVEAGDRVAMLALNSDRYHEYLLAVPWADAVLNPINIRWSFAEIGYALKDSGTSVLLVDDMFIAMVPMLRKECPGLRAVIHVGDGQAPVGTVDYEGLIAESAPIEDARRGGDSLAGLFYTGGTTGTPKGVMLSHANLLASTFGAVASGHLFGSGARYLHAAPMFHIADLIGWSATEILGGTHVFVPSFSTEAVLAAIAEHHVTHTLLVPTMIQLLLGHPGLDTYDLKSLRGVLYGASSIPQATLEQAMQAMPDASFTQLYGMTELSPVATMLSPAEHYDPALLRCAGRAAPHAEVRVVDPDDAECPRGAVGEVVARGPQVMLGYWNKPEETATALRGGWMHTGDGGYMNDDGYVFIVDRLKDMIITGGENVYSAEVENAIAQHPAVAACAVIGVPDPQWGERVHAVVVTKSDIETTAEAIRAHTKTLIAGYKAPRTVEFTDALPISGAGKILKHQLREQHSNQRG
ncbi:acyl-CoA synthetase [Nocardia suismassiliense]|uniref:acyl-CoA synthetase n=1 Tax=Nocardia suismassiliense TaxID=2077092 RepID=UPI000D1FB2DC|nr:long-chain fatty acid--CoA ligase [Nocardia suismassiliense]